jgi:hypothetical protein
MLEGIEEEQKEFEYKNKETKTRSIFFADTETDTSGNHKPILIGVVKDTKAHHVDSVKVFVNEDDSNKFYLNFMDYIIKYSKTDGVQDEEVIIYFHNLKYDYHVLLPYMTLSSAPCEKDGNVYSVDILYKKRKFQLRDSYKLANFALSKFQQTFALEEIYNKKEAIAYDYHKITNMQNKLITTKEYESFLKKDEIKIFRKNIEKADFDWTIQPKGYFNPIEYYKHYLRYDVIILAKGLQKFKETIDKITDSKLNMYNYLTISSLTYALMSMEGSFDGVYELTGNLREFCGKAVTGGRVQVNEKYKKTTIEGKFADYDGVSLYPSSIKRLCEEKGLPLGKCQRIETKDKETLDKNNYYIVKIRINKINKRQQLPMVSYKDEEGLLQYVNNVTKPIETYVDMITLTDWIEFQKIEYEILDGVYWNSGYNKKMGEVIQHLFDERLKQKKAGNEAMQQILKLMMNSSYGKTITKKTKTKNVVTNIKYKDNYIYNNFNTIKKITELNEKQFLIETDDLDITCTYIRTEIFRKI